MANLTNPNLDFDLESQIIKSKLLRAQEQQNANDQAILGYGGLVAPWQPGAGIGNALRKFSGRTREGRLNEDSRALSDEQLRRLTALQSQLAPSSPVNMQDPNAILAENARIQNLAGQMSKLPMGREQAKQLTSSTSALPQSLMKATQRQGFADQQRKARDATSLAEETRGRGYKAQDRDADFETWQKKEQWKLDNLPQTGTKGKSVKGDAGYKASDTYKSGSQAIDKVGQLLSKVNRFRDEGMVDDVSGFLAGNMTRMFGSAFADVTDQGDAAAALQSIKANTETFGRSREVAESGKLGNMAVQEWTKVGNSIAALESAVGSTEEFNAELANYQIALERYAAALESEMRAEFGEDAEISTAQDVAEETSRRREEIVTGEGSTGRNKTGPNVVETRVTRDGRRIEKLSDGTYREVK